MMGLEVHPTREGLVALRALVGLLSGVDGGVALGLLLGPEAAPTLAALQGADEERVAVGPLPVLDLRRRALKANNFHTWVSCFAKGAIRQVSPC